MIVRANFRQGVKSMAEVVRDLGDIPLDRILTRPPIGSATEQDLVAARSGPANLLCELVDGILVEKPMGTRESLMAGLMFGFIWDYLKDNDLGRLLGGDGACRLRPGNVRLPDVSFIPWDRMPDEDEPAEKIWSVIPALAIEVLSQSNTKAEIDRKLRELFAAGCKLAWVIDPPTQTAKVYTSAKRFKEIDAAGTFDGGKVLPGFKLPLADLFAATKRRKKKSR